MIFSLIIQYTLKLTSTACRNRRIEYTLRLRIHHISKQLNFKKKMKVFPLITLRSTAIKLSLIRRYYSVTPTWYINIIFHFVTNLHRRKN